MKPSLFAQHILIILGLTCVAMAPMLFFGITSGNDVTQHYQFAQTVHDSLAAGELYPGFTANTNGGLGDIGLRFYPPATYYFLSILFFIFDSWFVAALVGFLLIFALGGVGVYLWARAGLSETHALAAAAIYTFSPYHLNLIYNNCLIAEFAATAVFPWCFYFVTRVCTRSRATDVIGLAVSYALLVLTHLPSTIIVSLMLALYAVLLLKRGTLFRTLTRLTIAVCLALSASSVYWARMLPEMAWLKHSSAEHFSGIYDYRANFLFTIQNWLASETDFLNLWLADLMLAAILLMVIPTAAVLVTKRVPLSRFTTAAIVVFASAVLFTTPLSSFAWEKLAFLQNVQFPWRWMGVVSAFGAITASIGLTALLGSKELSGRTLTTLGVGLILVFFVFLSSFLMRGAVYKTGDEFRTHMEGIGRADSYMGWWPVWAKDSARMMTEPVTAGGRAVTIDSWGPLDRSFTIGTGEATTAHVRTFYYPHWYIPADSLAEPTFPDENGLISFDVTAGEQRFDLSFQEPPRVKLAYLVSGLTWISFVIAYLFIGYRAGIRRTSKESV